MFVEYVGPAGALIGTMLFSWIVARIMGYFFPLETVDDYDPDPPKISGIGSLTSGRTDFFDIDIGARYH